MGGLRVFMESHGSVLFSSFIFGSLAIIPSYSFFFFWTSSSLRFSQDLVSYLSN